MAPLVLGDHALGPLAGENEIYRCAMAPTFGFSITGPLPGLHHDAVEGDRVVATGHRVTPPLTNRWTRLVGVQHPIVQEGLGPFRTPKIAAAVSPAGGLGTVSMPGMPRDLADGARTFRAHIKECASLTDRPFAVNIPVGVDANGDVVEFTDVYIQAVLAARRADSALARQLRVLTGQVAGAISDVIRIAEFVPAMAAEAAAVLRRLVPAGWSQKSERSARSRCGRRNGATPRRPR